MDRPLSTAARRRTLDLPSKPEAGLAEWTSKIKALQRQVDEDEEAEHRRLEEEIQASRLARIRRSAGYSRAGSVDLSDSESIRTLKTGDSPAHDNAASTPDSKQQNQENALRKLMGERLATSESTSPPPRPRTTGPTAPMSLAAFIGGRATGPRLTKHAPQQDAHDPTQFEQRTHVTTPHPVFGRGGVAMPGMTARKTFPTSSASVTEDSAPTISTNLTGRDRKSSVPLAVKTFVQKVEEETLATHKTGVSYARERTISTPGGAASSRNVLIQSQATSPKSTSVAFSRPTSFSPSLSSTAPDQDRQISSTAPLRSQPLPSVSPIPRPRHSIQGSLTSSPIPPSQGPSITTPSLARPVQPSPRPSLSPLSPPSPNPSPAFLRATPPKEPTPSISRLQGRGFVRSMVQASSQLNAASPSVPPLPEKKDFGVKKHAPVLERWQSSTTSPAPSPPIISPKPVPMRKSHTVDPSAESPGFTPPRLVKADHTGRSLKSMASLPSIQHVDVISSSSKSDVGRDGRPRTPGLGSSTTMISYIKPTKTGDGPSLPSPPPRSRVGSPEVDELGMRVRARSRSRSKSREAVRRQATGGSAASATGKPLSHLTKDRAKKPRKGKITQDSNQRSQADVVVRFSTNDEHQLHAVHSETASLSNLISTSRVPEVVVSLPTTDTLDSLDKGSTSTKPISSLTEGFEDNFSPVPIASLSEKPPKLADVIIPGTPAVSDRVGRPTTPSPVSPVSSKEKPPASPVRHARIPSTGNRATVMDVAQAFHAQVSREPSQVVPFKQEGGRPDAIPPVAHAGSQNGDTKPDPPVSDRRKTSYERYSAIGMPPVEEEKTPVPSPVGTLARIATSPVPPHTKEDPVAPDIGGKHTQSFIKSALKTEDVASSTESKLFNNNRADDALPNVDIVALLKADRVVAAPDADLRTISVDVLSVIGSTANNVTRDIHIFYDMEILALIHRAKSRSTGLVSTRVWAWRGKRCSVGEREERKLQELARRYGTALVNVYQYCEPEDFVAVLGGQLVIRQGTRTHWSIENTTMHVVRSMGASTFIDELDLSIKNLCSGFSYCLSLLDTLYVWHGCGARETERQAARDYAKSLASAASNVVESIEGESDTDEMFWMFLGDGDYAKADYWKWRSSATDVCPRLWSVDLSNEQNIVMPVSSFANYSAVNDLVHIVDCVWEFFVLVGTEARGKRRDINTALSAAVKMSDLTASSRPFAPTVHVLILPSQLPTDLRLSFRDLDETELNLGNVPDHMNLVPGSEAEEHITRSAWDEIATRDPTMLPLGVHTSDLQ